MNRRFLWRWFRIGLVVILVCGSAVAAWQWFTAPKKEPTAAQIMARTSTQIVKIVVGPNVQVSKSMATIPHRETVIDADPSNSARLFISAIAKLPDSTHPGIVGYRSEDGGKNWSLAFERRPDRKEETLSDPALAFGPDGILYFVFMSYTDEDSEAWGTRLGTELAKGSLLFFRSPDGGKTWQAASTNRRFTDRPWLAVDCSKKEYRGRLYCTGDISSQGNRYMSLDVSADQGQTFLKSHTLPIAEKKQGWHFREGNPVVLADGTLAAIYHLSPSGSEIRPALHILFSDDGGQSVREGPRVPTHWYDPRVYSSNRTFFPQLAVDSTSPKYRDRLYAVWEDGCPQVRILFAYSPDKGQSWIGPTLLSEQPATAEDGNDYSAYMPSLAVNKDGVVAVTWYDSRGLPNDPSKSYPPGCNVRMRLSLDGGASWQPSLQANEQKIQASGKDLGDTAGIAADLEGNFHPVWIDDRTGTRQVWTAAVTVETK